MKVLLQHFRGKNGKVIIQEYNIAYLVGLSVKIATITTELSAVSALLVAVHLLWRIQSGNNM